MYSIRPLVPANYDSFSDCTYDASGNMTSIKFRRCKPGQNPTTTLVEERTVLATLYLEYNAAGQLVSGYSVEG